MKERIKRIILIFSTSLVITLCFFYIYNETNKYYMKQRAIRYSVASVRVIDGAENRVVMVATPGNIGESKVLFRYLNECDIQLIGSNSGNQSEWKKLSKFSLEPGFYTLTGLTGQKEQTVVIQLHIEDTTGFSNYINQYDDDVAFKVERDSEATLFVGVYPNIKDINEIIRPAVYKEDGVM